MPSRPSAHVVAALVASFFAAAHEEGIAQDTSGSGVGATASLTGCFIPLFPRVSRKMGKELRLDVYGAITTGGKVTVDNANGGGRYRDTYKIGPAPGAALVYRF